MKYYDEVKKYVDESFGKVISYHERTVYWLLKLKPDADEAMQIAAYAHDSYRIGGVVFRSPAFLGEPEALRIHQEEGGERIYEYLLSIGADEELSKKVKRLISKHEVGGTDDENVIKDADSISYLETNGESHAKRTDEFTKEEIRNKFAWMYERISDPKAKKLAKPFYEKAIKLLD